MYKNDATILKVVAGSLGLGVFLSMTGLVSGEEITSIFGVILFSLCFLGLYFLPTWYAKDHNRPMMGSVFVVNLFFGWTAIGWVVAFAMAALPPKHETQARV